jgi:hypothetical protein
MGGYPWYRRWTCRIHLTWTVTKPVAGGMQIDGFTATTRVSGMVQGEYTALVTRQAPAVQGAAAGSPGVASMATKQALIGTLPTPSFLANGCAGRETWAGEMTVATVRRPATAINQILCCQC